MLLFGTLFWRTGAGTPTPQVPAAQPRGRAPWLVPVTDEERRSKFRREREALPEEAQAVVIEVAARQAERLELDKQKQFEELHRELELRRLEWRSEYLEALTLERERLIDEEIGRRLRQIADDETVILLTLIAAASQL